MYMGSNQTFAEMLEEIENGRAPYWNHQKFVSQMLFPEKKDEYTEEDELSFEQEWVVDQAFDRLPEVEWKVIDARFGIHYSKCQTLKETAKLMKMTPHRVRQIEAKALYRLRCWIQKELPR